MNKFKQILFLLVLVNIPLMFAIGGLVGAEYKIDRNTIQELKTSYSEDPEVLEQIEELEHQQKLGITRNLLNALEVTNHDVFIIYYCRVIAVILFIIYTIFLFFLTILPLIIKKNRFLVLVIFKPLLYFTLLFSIIYLIAEVAVVLVGLSLAEAVLTGYITPKLFLLIGLGAIIGIWSLLQSVYITFVKNSRFIEAIDISPNEQKQIWDFVKNIATKIQAKMPANILVGLETNFYVTEGKIDLIGKKIIGETLYISLPLCRILQQEELAFIIGHELAHFSGKDVKYSKKFYPIYSITTHSLARLEAQESLILSPIVAILNIFLEGFESTEKEISRNRELAADKKSVSITNNPYNAASALLKLQAYASIMDVLLEKNCEEIKQGRSFRNLSSIYEEVSKEAEKDVLLSNLTNSIEKHPTDTHPSMIERLNAINVNPQDIIEDSLQIDVVKNKAIQLFDNFEEIEEQLTDMNTAIAYNILQREKIAAQEEK